MAKAKSTHDKTVITGDGDQESSLESGDVATDETETLTAPPPVAVKVFDGSDEYFAFAIWRKRTEQGKGATFAIEGNEISISIEGRRIGKLAFPKQATRHDKPDAIIGLSRQSPEAAMTLKLFARVTVNDLVYVSKRPNGSFVVTVNDGSKYSFTAQGELV